MAVMVEMPGARDVAKPVPLMIATDRLDETQVIWVLMSKFVPSENVPMAVNCSVIPAGVTGMLGLVGLMDMELRVSRVTVIVVAPEKSPEVAVMVAVPGAMPLTKPIMPTVATESLDELQVA